MKDNYEILSPIVSRSKCSVFMGRFENKKVAIKIFPEEGAFLREVEATKLLQYTPLISPQCYYYGQVESGYALMYEWIYGVSALDKMNSIQPSERIAFIDKLGHLHALFHNCTARAISVNQYEPSVFKMNFDTPWKNVIENKLCKWIKPISSIYYDQIGGQKIFDEILKDLETSEPSDQATLIHCDFLLRNLLVNEEGKIFIIDFDTCLIGDPVYDICKILWADFGGYKSNTSLRYINAWKAHTTIGYRPELLRLYIIITCIAALSWLSKYGNVSYENKRFGESAIKQIRRLL
jgi:aminoglycoside phosphotransferase (APT) family kinase protein